MIHIFFYDTYIFFMIHIFFHDTNIFFLIHIFFEFQDTRQIYVITRNINTAIATTVSMISGVKVI